MKEANLCPMGPSLPPSELERNAYARTKHGGDHGGGPLLSAAALPPPGVETKPGRRVVTLEESLEGASPPAALPEPGCTRAPVRGPVNLRPHKAVAETFDPAHPLRTLLMSEPDEIPAAEYAVKVAGWFRLMRAHRT